MEFLKTITTAYSDAKEVYSDAKDSAADYLESNIESTATTIKDGITLVEDSFSKVDSTLREGANDIIDNVAEQNEKFYTELKDAVQANITETANDLGFEKAGEKLSAALDQGADTIKNAGQMVTQMAHDKVEDFGNLQLDASTRRFGHEVLNAFPLKKIENKKLRAFSISAKNSADSLIETDLADFPGAIARTNVDALSLTLKYGLVMRHPIPDPTDLKIGQAKTVGGNVKAKVHDIVGGGVKAGAILKTARLSENKYEISLTFDASVKAGIGVSTMKGVDANVGLTSGRSITFRGDAKMIRAAKELYEKGTPDLESFKKIDAEEIRLDANIGSLVDVSAFVVSQKAGIDLGGALIWTEKAGLQTEISGSAHINTSISTGFGMNFSGSETSLLPNVSGGFTLKGTLKSGNTIELSAKAKGTFNGSEVDLSGTATLNLDTIGLSSEEAIALLSAGKLDPSDYGIQLKIKATKTQIVKDGTLETPFGSVVNKTTETKNLFKEGRSIPVGQMNLRF